MPIQNPYADELDKKRKKMNPAEIRIKNFEIKPMKAPTQNPQPLKKSYSDENMFETFTKDLMKSVKNQDQINEKKLEDFKQEQIKKNYRKKHFEVKHSSYDLTTHCSKVDESFVDYIGEPD